MSRRVPVSTSESSTPVLLRRLPVVTPEDRVYHCLSNRDKARKRLWNGLPSPSALVLGTDAHIPRPGLASADPFAEMGWSPETYTTLVVLERKLVLDGWPDDVTLARPSHIVGGIPMLLRLASMFELGKIKFVAASEEVRRAAAADPMSVFPVKRVRGGGGRQSMESAGSSGPVRRPRTLQESSFPSPPSTKFRLQTTPPPASPHHRKAKELVFRPVSMRPQYQLGIGEEGNKGPRMGRDDQGRSRKRTGEDGESEDGEQQKRRRRRTGVKSERFVVDEDEEAGTSFVVTNDRIDRYYAVSDIESTDEER